jgi:hypothetical protein
MQYFQDHLARIRHAAWAAVKPQGMSVLFVALHPELFAPEDFTGFAEPPIRSLTHIHDNDALQALSGRFDAAIVVNAATDENSTLFHLRRLDLAEIAIAWTWDNHHSPEKTLRINQLADVVVPGHKFCAGYMKMPSAVLGLHVPLGTNQWTRTDADRFFAQSAEMPRGNALHGGFVRWDMGGGKKRVELVTMLRQRLPENALSLLSPAERNRYHQMSPADRWRDWSRYKAGLILPLAQDLSTRFFDSLLTGQIPIVPMSCLDLDSVIPPSLQEQLPVIRFAEETPDAIEAAWRTALARFDAEGLAGAERRHCYALQNHHIMQRLKSICAQIELIKDGRRIRIEADGDAVGFVLGEP